MQQNKNKIFKDVGELKTMSSIDDFNADKVWNKLEIRIKHKNKKIYWIWLAASMLLLITVSAFFKLYHSNKKVEQIVYNKNQNNTKQFAIAKTNDKVNMVVLKPKNNHIKAPHNNVSIIDTTNTATKAFKVAFVDSTQMLKEEQQKTIANISIQKPIKKRLKIIYASDLYEESSQQIIQRVTAQEQPKKSFFKLLENSNKEEAENETTENQPQPNRTILGFKSKPTAPISINENQ